MAIFRIGNCLEIESKREIGSVNVSYGASLTKYHWDLLSMENGKFKRIF